MKHTGIIAGVAALGVSLTAVAAWAQGPGGMHGHQMSFQEMDADGSGEITIEEMTNFRATRFSQSDGNSDGLLSRDEMIAAGQARVLERVDAMIERFDANKDGSLSLDEMPSPRNENRAGQMFERLDQDSSGGISQAEFDEARAMMRDHDGFGRGDHKKGHKMGHKMGRSCDN